MEDFQISVDAEEKALQDDLLGFSILWVYDVKSSWMKSTVIVRIKVLIIKVLIIKVLIIIVLIKHGRNPYLAAILT